MVMRGTGVWRAHGVLVAGLMGSLAATSGPAQASNLNAYRSQFTKTGTTATELDRAAAERRALARVEKLRRALGTETLAYAAPARASANSSRSHAEGSAAFIKRRLSKVALEIQRAEANERPPTFQPSDFLFEVDAGVQARRKALCLKNVEQKWPELLQELSESLLAPRLPQSPATPEELEDIKSISAYIERNEPEVAPGKPRLKDVLGELYRADSVDGVVTTLRFTRRPGVVAGSAQPLSYADSLALGLSMASTFRTGQDRYFIAVQECLRDKLESELEERKKELEEASKLLNVIWPFGASEKHKSKDALKVEIERLAAATSALEERIEGAKAANATAAKLSKAQLEFLIDLLLQLRGADLPAAEEMPMLATYVDIVLKAEPGRGGVAREQEQATQDFLFYQGLHDDLYALEEYLRQEAKIQQTNKSLIERLRGEGGK